MTERAQSTAYRCQTQRMAPTEAMISVTAAASPGLALTSTAKILMDTPICAEKSEEDTEDQRVIRQVVEYLPRTTLTRNWSRRTERI